MTAPSHAGGRRKIVRDLLADRIPAAALTQAADLESHRDMLADKSAEEMAEIRASAYVDPSEYADALEVLVSLAELSGVKVRGRTYQDRQAHVQRRVPVGPGLRPCP